MKKLLLPLLFFMLLGKAWAVGPVQINPFIGANTAFFSDLENKSNRIAFQGGAIARIGNDRFYVGPGLIFLSQSVKTSDLNYNGTSAENFSVQGIQVPVFLGVKVAMFHFGVGPAANFTTKYKFDGKDLEKDDFKFKSTLWSLKAEAVVKLALLTIGLDYDLGLTRIADNDQAPKVGKIGLNVGIAF